MKYRNGGAGLEGRGILDMRNMRNMKKEEF
jgi:hypothetical protein